MAFWSGEKVSERARRIVEPFNKAHIEYNAYTLHMGGEYYRTEHINANKRATRTKALLTPKEPFAIPPGQFAFLLTHEAIALPNDTMAFISMKAGIKFQGLVNISGFHVDPGYQGKLVFAVFNAGPSPVSLQEGMPLFLIWFADLDRPSKMVRNDKPGFHEISNDLIKGMNQEILSLQSLSEEIWETKRKMQVQSAIFKWGAGLATAFVLAITVGLIMISIRVNLFGQSMPGFLHQISY